MPPKQFIYFVEGATDSVDDFDAQGVSFVPLAGGPGDCDSKVSCYHLAPGAQIAEIPCFNDIAILVVHAPQLFDVAAGAPIRRHIRWHYGMID